MSDRFDVIVVAQEYPPEVIRRLAGLMQTSPTKLAVRLRASDLVVKRQVDEETAQKYAALIYDRTGAEAVVTGGPDLSSLDVRQKPAVSKAADPEQTQQPWYRQARVLYAGLASVIFAIVIALVVLLSAPAPEDSLQELAAVIEAGDTQTFSQYVAVDAMLASLYQPLINEPDAKALFPIGRKDEWIERNRTTLDRWLKGDTPEEDSGLLELFRLLNPMSAKLSRIERNEKDSNKATAFVQVERPDLQLSLMLELAMRAGEEHWRLMAWRNAHHVLHTIIAAEESRLKAINTDIERQLGEVLGGFRYEESIAGVHRFSLGQLLIEARLTNQSPRSLEAFNGELRVFGVDSERVYAAKPFEWKATERLLPPGGSANIEAFFSLDGPFPDLVDVIETKAEALEVGYGVHHAVFRGGEPLATFERYSDWQVAQDN